MPNMLQFWILVGLISCVCSEPSNRLWNDTMTDKLKRDIFQTYDRFARPNENVTNVELKLTIRHIDIDEDKSVLNTYGWLLMEWSDNKLQWNESEYGGLGMLHAAVNEIWIPDIFLYNSATGSSQNQFGNTNCIVYSNGTVLWVPPAHLETFCDLNLNLWPYDVHTCHMVLGSWTFNGYQINLESPIDSINQEIAVQNHQWKIRHANATRNVRNKTWEQYVDIDFAITIERRSPMFVAVVLTPAITVILMTLTNFWLPAQSGEKIMLNGFIVMVIVAFLLYFAQKVPVMAIHTPLIVLFYSSSLYLLSFSMILSVLVINMSRMEQARAVPWCITSCLDGFTGTALGLKTISVQPRKQQHAQELIDHQLDDHLISDEHQIIQKTSNRGTLQQSWILLATAIDRIAFIVYGLVFAILAICYSV